MSVNVQSAPTPLELVAQGLRLRVWDHGGDGLPVVLFVHGYLDTGRSFDAIARALAGQARCLALDLRGHGDSDRVGAGGSYHLLDHVKDLALVTTALHERGLGIDLLVGHSMGGNVCFLFAGADPASVPRLLLVDNCGGPAEESDEVPSRLHELVASVRSKKAAFQPAPSLEEALARLRGMNPGLTEAGARRMLEPVMRPRADGRLDFPFDAGLRGPTPVRWPEAAWLALAARLTMPVVVVRATDGYVSADAPTPERLAAMKSARMIEVTGGHHLHVDQPTSIADVVCDLLAAAIAG
jgi:pimeloyl-ACP methyl ester carboxylesterase